MSNVSRKGDSNNAGGKIMHGASTVFINGVPAGLHVSQITPHSPFGKPHPPHAASRTTGGVTSTVFCEGQQLIKVGTTTSCGHVIVEGSPDVFVP